MFRFAIERLEANITPALCKEDAALWKALGMKFQGCHCLLGASDGIVKERQLEMKQARQALGMPGMGRRLPLLA